MTTKTKSARRLVIPAAVAVVVVVGSAVWSCGGHVVVSADAGTGGAGGAGGAGASTTVNTSIAA